METCVALRVIGQDLDPDEITKLLGVEPTSSQFTGQVFHLKHSGKKRIAKVGMWSVDSPMGKEEDLEAQFLGLLGLLPKEETLWASLANKYEIDLWCGAFLSSTNQVIELTPKFVAEVSRLHASISLDTYAPIDE